jgi:hypothetical protein
VKNVMFHLTSSGKAGGDPWSLIIVHGHDNRNYVQRTTKDIEGVQVCWLPARPSKGSLPGVCWCPRFLQRLSCHRKLDRPQGQEVNGY